MNSVNHPAFTPPEDPHIKIWRYMDFTKFVSMLETQALYFARADKLGDPFEGSYSRGNEILRSQTIEENPVMESAFKKMGGFMKWARGWTNISCWHMNNHESAAMWKLYAQTNEAISIQTTYKILRDCMDESVFIGVVKYIDYEKEWMPETNAFYPYTHKRKSFEHENELRAVIQDLPINGENIDTTAKPPSGSQWKNVDLNTLIENVYVAPTSAAWFQELVNDVINTYGLNKEVIRSSLENEPFF